MIFEKLYRKKNPLTDEGLPWLRGDSKHSYTARRNSTGQASVSALLVRSLLSTLDGMVTEAYADTAVGYMAATVISRTKKGKVANCGVEHATDYFFPFASGSTTYHFGVIGILQAIAEPAKAQDFLLAYHDLMIDYSTYGKHKRLETNLVRTQDELYYWLRYRHKAVEPGNDLDQQIRMSNSQLDMTPAKVRKLDLSALTDPTPLEKLIEGTFSAEVEETSAISCDGNMDNRFVGWQSKAFSQSLAAHENVLLAGPTGTGKTMLVQQTALQASFDLTVIEGKEGMIDLDFLGAILPQEDGSRKWVDGPLLRAMRMAQTDQVLLFLDEINRIPRVHVNLLIGLLNPKSGAVCRSMQLPVQDDEAYYVVEVPMTSELIWCPVQHLRFVAAGNFGRTYAVYDLDPALRRRFETVLEFEYLEYNQEMTLIKQETGLKDRFLQIVCKVAMETRRMMGNGELPGCIDTATLINWARKCVLLNSRDITAVMQAASLTWADQVCGRDHTGKVNTAALKGLADYAHSIAGHTGGRK
ncbi:MAG: AAA family ATPase [Anaerolineaceae bacterium]|nr:AAA family ATPase [Anaerolineaceae bacterium]